MEAGIRPLEDVGGKGEGVGDDIDVDTASTMVDVPVCDGDVEVVLPLVVGRGGVQVVDLDGGCGVDPGAVASEVSRFPVLGPTSDGSHNIAIDHWEASLEEPAWMFCPVPFSSE